MTGRYNFIPHPDWQTDPNDPETLIPYCVEERGCAKYCRYVFSGRICKPAVSQLLTEEGCRMRIDRVFDHRGWVEKEQSEPRKELVFAEYKADWGKITHAVVLHEKDALIFDLENRSVFQGGIVQIKNSSKRDSNPQDLVTEPDKCSFWEECETCGGYKDLSFINPKDSGKCAACYGTGCAFNDNGQCQKLGANVRCIGGE